MTKYTIDFDKLILEGIGDDRAMQKLFREIESGTLSHALIGANSETVEKCCRNISVRRTRKLKDVLEHSDKISRSYIQQCRHEIIEATQGLFDRGEICLENGFRREAYETVIAEKEETLTDRLLERLEEAAKSGKLDLESLLLYGENITLEDVKTAFKVFENLPPHFRPVLTELNMPVYLFDYFDYFVEKGFFSPEHIEVLCIRNYSYDAVIFPQTFKKCKNLKKLELTGIHTVPQDLGNQLALMCLSITNAYKFKTVPLWIGEIKTLTELNLRFTGISSLPDSFGNLSSLTKLNVSYTKIKKLPDCIGNLKELVYLDLSYTPIKNIPAAIGDLPALKEIRLYGTGIEKLPVSITSNKKIAVVKEMRVQPDTGSLSPADFTALYYQYMEALRYFHQRARREGLLALEEELENIENEFFHLGMQLLVDGTDGSVIRSVLSNYIAHETDYYKRLLRQIIMEWVLAILDGDDSELLIIRLNSMVNIKDNIISEKITEYLCGDIHALDTCCDVMPGRPALAEREEVVFIKRVHALSEKARREGLLALEAEFDKAGIACGDIFEYGLPFVVDNVDPCVINRILDNLIAHESDPVKNNLCAAKKEALLSIQCGDNPRILLEKYLAHFGEDIRQTIKKLFDYE